MGKEPLLLDITLMYLEVKTEGHDLLVPQKLKINK